MSAEANKQGRFAIISITTRLTVLYTLATLSILIFAIVFQFFALINDLDYEDNEFLSDKIRVIRAMIDRYPNDSHHLAQEVKWEGGNREHTRYLVRILDQGGRKIMATGGMDQLVPIASFPLPALSGGRIGRGVKHHAPGEKVFLINAAWAASGNNHHFRLIQIALDVTDEEALLSAYRRKMTFVFLAGLFFSALLSVAVARSGLRPLSIIAASAGEVSIDTLSHRVGNRPWPRELMQVATAIDSMLSRLELSFVRLSEFSANLAHELRTPLNNLRGEAEVTLARSRTPEEYQRVMESSLEEYSRLSRMIDDILFLARAEQLHDIPLIDGHEQLNHLCDYFGTMAHEQGISLTTSGEGMVRADLSLFQRAVGNLIANALRYTPSGGEIRVILEQSETYATVTVADSGIGIPPEQLDLVFDRFYRSSSARSLHPQGSGLGLAIINSIMALHGGEISLTSTPGQGTIVTLRFPFSHPTH